MPRNPSASTSQTVPNPARGAGARHVANPVSPPVAIAGSESADPAPEDIRLRAFQIYQRRGEAPGRELEDWEQARREILEERRGRGASTPRRA